MNNDIFVTTLVFKGIKCNIQIIPDEFNCYQLLVKTTKPFGIKDRAALHLYLRNEGYIDAAFNKYWL